MPRANGKSAVKKKRIAVGSSRRGHPGDPEWEAMKARCRNLQPAEAVRECAYLSDLYRRRFGMPEIDLAKIVKALQVKKIPFVLTGAHGIASWTGRPRSTHDVDILVKAGRNHQRAVKAIQALYPDLEMRLFTGVAAFFVPGEKESVIDVTYPHRLDIEQTLKSAVWFEDQGIRMRIPELETALANKYGAMLALNRDFVKRGQDAIDFATMVRHSTDEGRDPINLERLAELGELVWADGGGAEILGMVEQAKVGKVPTLDA
jgi:Nucleotidyl transferase AbiEii toxin, Type IV TA system